MVAAVVMEILLSVALVLCTLALAWVTKTLVRETRKMREVQEALAQPRLSIRAEGNHPSDPDEVILVLRNEGGGPARNVKFRFEGEDGYFRETRDKRWGITDVPQRPLFRKGLESWESGQMFTFVLGVADEEAINRAAQAPWKFHIRYENLSGEKIRQTIQVDFSTLEGLYFAPNYLQSISNSLEMMKNVVAEVDEESISNSN